MNWNEELVTGPSILFLDEPTTGLPAGAALEVMKTVRKLADHICVICTIHQVIAVRVNWIEQHGISKK